MKIFKQKPVALFQIKRFKRLKYLIFKQEYWKKNGNTDLLHVAEDWAVRMQIFKADYGTKETFKSNLPASALQSIEKDREKPLTEMEKAYITSVLKDFWKYGRKLIKWYRRNQFCKIELV